MYFLGKVDHRWAIHLLYHIENGSGRNDDPERAIVKEYSWILLHEEQIQTEADVRGVTKAGRRDVSKDKNLKRELWKLQALISSAVIDICFRDPIKYNNNF